MSKFCLTLRDKDMLLVLLFFQILNVFQWFSGARRGKALGSIRYLHWLDREVCTWKEISVYLCDISDIGLLCSLASQKSFSLLCLSCAQQIKDLFTISVRHPWITSRAAACTSSWAVQGCDVCLCPAVCDTAMAGLSHLGYPCCLQHLCLSGHLEHLGSAGCPLFAHFSHQKKKKNYVIDYIYT